MVEPFIMEEAGGEAEERDLDGELATGLPTWLGLTIVELSCICICGLKSLLVRVLEVL